LRTVREMAHGLRRPDAPTFLPEDDPDEHQGPSSGESHKPTPSARAQKADDKFNRSLERYGSRKADPPSAEFNNLRVSDANRAEEAEQEDSDDDSIGYDSADEADDDYMVPGRFTLKHQSEAFLEVAKAEKLSPVTSRSRASSHATIGGGAGSPSTGRGVTVAGQGTPPRALPAKSLSVQPAVAVAHIP